MNSRYRGHECSIRTEKDHPVAIHYRSYNHIIDDYSITIVNKESNKNRRLKIGRIMDHPIKYTNPQRTEWQMVVQIKRKLNSVHSEQTTHEL